MPWIDELLDPHMFCIRDLVTLSTLPAIWKDDDPRQIADSVAAALISSRGGHARRFRYRSDAPDAGWERSNSATSNLEKSSPFWPTVVASTTCGPGQPTNMAEVGRDLRGQKKLKTELRCLK
jgi:hypothetical protein